MIFSSSGTATEKVRFKILGFSFDRTYTQNLKSQSTIDLDDHEGYGTRSVQLGPVTVSIATFGAGVRIQILAAGIPVASQDFTLDAPINWRIRASGHGVSIDATLSLSAG